jgi:molybdenum cofactor cytidylyltransferase
VSHPADPARVGGVILAAGRATRFGSPKMLAELDHKPLVRHVLDAALAAGLDPIVVVGGPDGALDGLDLGPARMIVNPSPEQGLSTSVRLGLAALDDDPDVAAAVVLLGDQPRVQASTIRILLASATVDAPLAAPAYSDDAAPNPVVARRAAWRLADELVGDRGFAPILARHPELVRRVPIEGSNPDVDTPADLAGLATDPERAWAERVRANREQVERVREVPDGADFYDPVRSLFAADPRRTDDAVLDALVRLTQPDDVWLDVGAGAGRYALPLALRVARVDALDPSPGMLDGLRSAMAQHGIENVRPILARWPPAPGSTAAGLTADVVLIAHVGYDVESIHPFIAALEQAARRLVVAVLMERQPASLADPFWPPVHGEPRVGLAALPEFLELLGSRGIQPRVERFPRDARAFSSPDELLAFLRRQTWVQPDGDRDRRLQQELDARLIAYADGTVGLPDERGDIGLVTWRPPGAPPDQPEVSGSS